jgi:SAM-dependent methyltransferase
MYIFDNSAIQTRDRLGALSSVFDPGTIRHLEDCGLGEGWTCLEVGGGGGTIVKWLADKVGPTGSILATDLNTRLLEGIAQRNVEIRRHDICNDPLPLSTFDLAHARLVLEHVADKRGALRRMAGAIKPGGWIVIEDFEVLPFQAASEHEVFPKIIRVMRDVLQATVGDFRFGRSLGARLRELDFAEVNMEGRLFVWRSGSLGASLMRLNCEQLRPAILATGQITEAEFEDDLKGLDDSTFDFASPILWTAWGRKPKDSALERFGRGKSDSLMR